MKKCWITEKCIQEEKPKYSKCIYEKEKTDEEKKKDRKEKKEEDNFIKDTHKEKEDG